jgi:hypothetical protein
MQNFFMLQQVMQIVTTTVWRLIERTSGHVHVCVRVCVAVFVCMYATYARMTEWMFVIYFLVILRVFWIYLTYT